MRIGIVGTGVSGLVAGYLLAPEHDVVLFEQDDRVGGHVHTHDLKLGGRRYAVDTGFIVFNDWTYPNFIRLLARLGVPSQPTRMTFGVSDERSGVEYSAASPRALFATRRTLLSPTHYRMVAEILRFGRTAARHLEARNDDPTLADFVAEEGYGEAFLERFIVPMAGAIWSADRRTVLDGSARFFVRFFEHHGMLNVIDQPVWRVVRGGSQRYVEPLVATLAGRIRVSTPIQRVSRRGDAVEVETRAGARERFDHVILACHSDQALQLLADPSDAEREVLGAIEYQPNEAVLHTDESVLPRRRLARAAWNYRVTDRNGGPVAVTYDMNRLQGLDAPVTFCVTLNESERIDPSKILRRIKYHHPIFTRRALGAQARHAEISGVQRRTHYAGAYWFNGFHEDGVRSALRVAGQLGQGSL